MHSLRDPLAVKVTSEQGGTLEVTTSYFQIPAISSGMESQPTADDVQDERSTADIEEGTPTIGLRRGFLNQLPTWSEFWRNEWLVVISMP